MKSATANFRVRDLIDDFLILIRQASGNQEQNESNLERLLDALALARHDISFSFDEADYPDPPDWPYNERRAIVRERFPEYGYYNIANPISTMINEAELVVGDAIDDIADIAGDLSKIAWCWQNTSEADALWHFEFTFNLHWGQHLRSLQLYLYSFRNGW